MEIIGFLGLFPEINVRFDKDLLELIKNHCLWDYTGFRMCFDRNCEPGFSCELDLTNDAMG
jgi:hypothetical protein